MCAPCIWEEVTVLYHLRDSQVFLYPSQLQKAGKEKQPALMKTIT